MLGTRAARMLSGAGAMSGKAALRAIEAAGAARTALRTAIEDRPAALDSGIVASIVVGGSCGSNRSRSRRRSLVNGARTGLWHDDAPNRNWGSGRGRRRSCGGGGRSFYNYGCSGYGSGSRLCGGNVRWRRLGDLWSGGRRRGGRNHGSGGNRWLGDWRGRRIDRRSHRCMSNNRWRMLGNRRLYRTTRGSSRGTDNDCRSCDSRASRRRYYCSGGRTGSRSCRRCGLYGASRRRRNHDGRRLTRLRHNLARLRADCRWRRRNHTRHGRGNGGTGCGGR
jgi:hypothetical protein